MGRSPTPRSRQAGGIRLPEPTQNGIEYQLKHISFGDRVGETMAKNIKKAKVEVNKPSSSCQQYVTEEHLASTSLETKVPSS
jgi:hypothetical protein